MIIRQRSKDFIYSPMRLVQIMQQVLRDMPLEEREKEHFFVVGLSTSNQIKFIDLVSTGTLNVNLVHPREVFRVAIRKGVASLIALHNHPSGNKEPSPEDDDITKRLKQAGNLIGIELMDHVVMGNNEFTSYRSTNRAPY